MLKNEWKQIMQSWWLKVVFIAIMIIPVIYTAIFLGSMWDPYGNTNQIPVAVVNLDESTTYEGKQLHIGKDLTTNLLNNDTMKFIETDETQAMKGLENQDYYMVITIPKDFSKHATTLLSDQPKKMVLEYTTNPGTNYIASKIDESAINKIQSEVSSTVTKTYAETLFSSIQTVSNGLQEAADGSQQLEDGSSKLEDGNQTISDNLQKLANSTITFTNGTSSLENGLQAYTDGVLQVHQGVSSLKDGTQSLVSATPSLTEGINALKNGSSSLENGISTYTNGVQQAYQGTQQLVQSQSKLLDGVDALAQGTEQLKDGNLQVSNGLSQLHASLSSATSNDQLTTLQEQNSAALKQLNVLKKQSATQLQAILALPQDQQVSALQAYLTTMDTAMSQIETLTSANQQAIKTLYDGMQQADTAVSQLAQGSTQVQQGLEKLNASIQGGTYIDAESEKTIVKENSLQYGLQAYTNGVSQVNQGLSTLSSSSQALVSGSQQLSSGTSQLAQKTPTLVQGIEALANGSNTLFDGTSQLIQNSNTLVSGSQQLAQGSIQLQDGASQLAQGAITLQNGLTTLHDGASTLTTELAKGAKESKLSTTEKTYDMLASPVTLQHHEISTVANNGHAMAPYMMSVALYVACMSFTLMFPLLKNIKHASSGIHFWLSKASVMYTISTGAAILMVSCLMLINGLKPAQVMMTFLFAVLVSAAFMTMISFFTMTLGRIGEFLMLIFMVINLGGSAGTYPLETAGSFYHFLHPLVPYTYSVDGFRRLLSMQEANILPQILVFAGILICFSILSMIYCAYRKKHPIPLVKEIFPEGELE